ncbi:MAG: HIRAN domain-containing protein, partial [Firmicutes bacterium]|nr:HIRAN domain-containing protein [Bacillota bacterium]
ILLNAFAEEYHHSFPWEYAQVYGAPWAGNSSCKPLSGISRYASKLTTDFFKPFELMWGVLLGEKMMEVYDYYERTGEFYSRVVGIQYENRWKNVKELKIGEEVLLLRESWNPYDPNAIRVFTTTGKDLGFIRRTLAEMLAPKIDKGMQYEAEVAFAWDGGDAEGRWIYLKVKKKGVGFGLDIDAGSSIQEINFWMMERISS